MKIVQKCLVKNCETSFVPVFFLIKFLTSSPLFGMIFYQRLLFSEYLLKITSHHIKSNGWKEAQFYKKNSIKTYFTIKTLQI